jgi:tetratricopeptide (TPR) repeat protein
MKILIALLLLFLLSPLAQAGLDDPRAHADYYIDIFGEVDPASDARVRHAYEIFERVRRVAEDPIGFTPALKVINSDGKPWAVALPDGYVILSHGALKICYDNTDQARGDARLAFVLGHELAHLVSRDFWHRNVFLSLSGTTQPKTLSGVQEIVASELFDTSTASEQVNVEAIKRKELHADDAGFLYASLAGFKTPLIFQQRGDQQDFLRDWVRQTRTIDDQTHLGPEERSAFLQTRFSNIINKVGVFNAGITLALFGHFRDAQYLFEAFAQSFPSHEVATNLGYVHLQQALQLIPETRRTRFWLPARLLDLPDLQMTTRTLAGNLPPAVTRHLREAEKYLLKAVNARADDLASRLNLAVVYFHLQEYYKARDRVEEARTLDEHNPDVLALRALILNEQEKDIDMWPVATRILQKLAAKGHLPARYNLARLYEERGRKSRARELWSSLQSDLDKLPQDIATAACKALTPANACTTKTASPLRYPEKILDPTLMAGYKHPETLPPGQWRRDTLQAGPLFVEYLHDSKGNIVLMVDGHPQLFSAQAPADLSAPDLVQQFGQPTQRQPLGHKTFWRYNASWGAIIENGQITTIQGIAY